MGNIALGFRIEEKQHFLLYNANDIVKFEDRPYFNKNTMHINLIKGVECNEILNKIDDKEYILIEVVYRISNYFSDISGRHIRNKRFIYDRVNFYNEGKMVKRLPKEVKSAFEEYIN